MTNHQQAQPTPPQRRPWTNNANDQGGNDLGASSLLNLPPVPAPGAITADLSADTDDPAVLKQRLTRARERLGFYESFDRIIQENIRRSGEMMLEAIAIREQAQTQAVDAADTRAELERRLAEQRDQHASLFSDLQRSIAEARAVLDGLDERVRSALGHRSDLAAPTAPSVKSEPAAEVTEEPAAAAVPPDTPPVQDAPAPVEEPRVVEVLVHGVPRAADALALQRHLGTLAHVVTVEAREFAEGILRLQVTTLQPLGAGDLSGWTGGEAATVLRAEASVLELTLPDADGR